MAELGEVGQQLGSSADARLAKAAGRIDGDALKQIHLAMVGDAQRFIPTPVAHRIDWGEQTALDQIEDQVGPTAAVDAKNLRAA